MYLSVFALVRAAPAASRNIINKVTVNQLFPKIGSSFGIGTISSSFIIRYKEHYFHYRRESRTQECLLCVCGKFVPKMYILFYTRTWYGAWLEIAISRCRYLVVCSALVFTRCARCYWNSYNVLVTKQFFFLNVYLT